MNFDRWTSTHTFALIRSAAIGAGTVGTAAAITYFESVPYATLAAAFTSKAALYGLLAGLFTAVVNALLNLAKQSFVGPTSGPATPSIPEYPSPVISVKPSYPPRNEMVAIGAALVLAGCSGVQSQDTLAATAYAAEQSDCVLDHKAYPTRPEVDACRHALRVAYCHEHPASEVCSLLDGGVE